MTRPHLRECGAGRISVYWSPQPCIEECEVNRFIGYFFRWLDVFTWPILSLPSTRMQIPFRLRDPFTWFPFTPNHSPPILHFQILNPNSLPNQCKPAKYPPMVYHHPTYDKQKGKAGRKCIQRVKLKLFHSSAVLQACGRHVNASWIWWTNMDKCHSCNKHTSIPEELIHIMWIASLKRNSISFTHLFTEIRNWVVFAKVGFPNFVSISPRNPPFPSLD